MFAGQFLAVLRIAPEDSNLHFWDAVFPFRLYGLVLKRLPTTQTTLFLGIWAHRDNQCRPFRRRPGTLAQLSAQKPITEAANRALRRISCPSERPIQRA